MELLLKEQTNKYLSWSIPLHLGPSLCISLNKTFHRPEKDRQIKTLKTVLIHFTRCRSQRALNLRSTNFVYCFFLLPNNTAMDQILIKQFQ